MNFIWYILIGIIAGYVAGKITRGGGFGLLVNLVLGIIGGVLGGWVFSRLSCFCGLLHYSAIPANFLRYIYYIN